MMQVSSKYKEFKKLSPQYEQWKNERDLQNAKRLEYLKQNPKEAQNAEQDNDRADALLRAIDVMDEYSQSYAEDMEISTEMLVSQATNISSVIGMALGGLFGMSKLGKNLAQKLPKNLVEMAPAVFSGIGAVVLTIAAMIPLQSWATGQQVKASRKGRFEAMKNELSNPVQFAILADEQKKQLGEIAETIPDSEVKKGIKETVAKSSPFKRLKDLIFDGKKAELERAEFSKQFEADPNNFELPLSEEDAAKAKGDKQLLTKLSERIDLASQDYTENIEFATNVIQTTAFAGGGLMGFVTSKLIELLKVRNENVKAFVPMAAGFLLPLLSSIFATKIQKQAARVARFKTMQELKQNPQEFIYVDDEKAAHINAKITPKPKKNFVKFLVDTFKENLEYNKHLKTSGLKERKFTKALSSLQLNESQLKEAKILQRNTFNTFNKIDEKSQTYAESTEAFWEKIKTPVVSIASFAGTGLSTLLMMRKAQSPNFNPLAMMAAPLLGIMPALFINVFIDAIATKEQKQASRVANMEAIKELEDYRHFADYNHSEVKA